MSVSIVSRYFFLREFFTGEKTGFWVEFRCGSFLCKYKVIEDFSIYFELGDWWILFNCVGFLVVIVKCVFVREIIV